MSSESPTTALGANGGAINGGLPSTGSNQRGLVVVGLLLMLGGMLSLLLARRPYQV